MKEKEAIEEAEARRRGKIIPKPFTHSTSETTAYRES